MRRNYNEWMAESVKELTPAGKIKRPSYETVVDWVKMSWNAVDTSLIQRSFKCCGISNNRDGSEDGLIFDYDRLGRSGSGDNEIDVLADKENNMPQEADIEDDIEYDYENYDNVWDD